jgi:hypothetical protein
MINQSSGVVLVTGASLVGRSAIACVLGEEGATV